METRKKEAKRGVFPSRLNDYRKEKKIMNREKLLENLIVLKDVKFYSPILHKLTLEILGEKYVFLISLRVREVKLLKKESISK